MKLEFDNNKFKHFITNVHSYDIFTHGLRELKEDNKSNCEQKSSLVTRAVDETKLVFAQIKNNAPIYNSNIIRKQTRLQKRTSKA